MHKVHTHLSNDQREAVRRAARRRGYKFVAAYLRDLAMCDAAQLGLLGQPEEQTLQGNTLHGEAAIHSLVDAILAKLNRKPKKQTDWLAKAKEAVANG